MTNRRECKNIPKEMAPTSLEKGKEGEGTENNNNNGLRLIQGIPLCPGPSPGPCAQARPWAPSPALGPGPQAGLTK